MEKEKELEGIQKKVLKIKRNPPVIWKIKIKNKRTKESYKRVIIKIKIKCN